MSEIDPVVLRQLLEGPKENYAHWRSMAADTVNHFWFTNREAGVLLAEIDELRAALRALAGAVVPPPEEGWKAVPLPTPRDYWKCFHCGEVFVDEASAANHFGPRDPNNALHQRAAPPVSAAPEEKK